MIRELINLTKLNEEDVVNLLPYVLLEIRNYTNQYFLTTTNIGVKHIEDNKVYVDGNPTDKFLVGDTIELLNSENNILLYQIKELHDDYVVLYQDIYDDKQSTMIKLLFRGVNLRVVATMLTHNLKDNMGIQSQNLGGYSVTFAKGKTMYPQELYSGLNSLKKINDDFREYRKKGYAKQL